jgi:hypothetical protein
MKLNNLRFLLVLCLLIGLTSILPAQKVIQVAAGTDVISGAMATAPTGAIIELTTSGGFYVQTGDINVTKDVTVRAAAGLAAKPTIICGGSNTFNVNGGGLTVSGIKFDDPAGGLYFITVKADTVLKGTNTADFSLRVDNCEFWRCGQRCIYTSDGTMHPLEFLIVTNSRFFDNVKQIIYEKGIRNTPSNPTQPGGAKYIKFENDLIVGTSSASDGYASYIEPANRDSATYTYPTVVLNHLTVDSMAIGGISTYTTPNATITNCIVINMKDTSKYAYQVETGRFANAPRSHIWNSVYNGPHFASYGGTAFALYPDTGKIIKGTPTFTNAGARDYSLTAGSLGKGAGTDGLDIGYIPGGLVATAVETRTDQVPTSFQLSQNYPNPFNPATTIRFSIPKVGKYSVNVFNLLGQKVANLYDGMAAAGEYSVRFDASHLSSGMYIYTLTGDGVNIAKKMLLLK